MCVCVCASIARELFAWCHWTRRAMRFWLEQVGHGCRLDHQDVLWNDRVHCSRSFSWVISTSIFLPQSSWRWIIKLSFSSKKKKARKWLHSSCRLLGLGSFDLWSRLHSHPPHSPHPPIISVVAADPRRSSYLWLDECRLDAFLQRESRCEILVSITPIYFFISSSVNWGPLGLFFLVQAWSLKVIFEPSFPNEELVRSPKPLFFV
jgi:hypothetical protein